MRQTKTLLAATIFGLFSLYLCACQNQGASKTGQTGSVDSSEALTPSGGLNDLADSLDTAADSASGDEKTALQDASSSVSDLAQASKSAETFSGSNGSGVENALEAALQRIKSSADQFQQLQAYQAFQQALYRIYYTRNIYRWKHPGGMYAYTRNLGADALPFIQGGFAFGGIAFRVFKEQRGPELSLSIPLVDVYRCHVPGVKWKIVFNNDANAACEGQTQEKVLLGKVSAGYTSWSVFRIYRAILPNNENASLSLTGHNARVAAGWTDKKDAPVVYSAN